MVKVVYLRGAKKMKDNVTIFDVADVFLSMSSMTHKKLQKLCYYAYAWYQTLFRKKLFNSTFEAWVHGPVAPELYNVYKNFGWNPIEQDNTVSHMIDSEVYEFLEDVYESYGKLSGNQLELLTHSEEPWKFARRGLEAYEPSNEQIDDNIIVQYYSKVFENGQND